MPKDTPTAWVRKALPGTRWSGIYLCDSNGLYASPTPYAPCRALRIPAMRFLLGIHFCNYWGQGLRNCRTY